MAMKNRDYLTLLATTHLAKSLEEFTKNLSHKKTVKHINIISYKDEKGSANTLDKTPPECSRLPSPNERCGFATGNTH